MGKKNVIAEAIKELEKNLGRTVEVEEAAVLRNLIFEPIYRAATESLLVRGLLDDECCVVVRMRKDPKSPKGVQIEITVEDRPDYTL